MPPQTRKRKAEDAEDEGKDVEFLSLPSDSEADEEEEEDALLLLASATIALVDDRVKSLRDMERKFTIPRLISVLTSCRACDRYIDTGDEDDDSEGSGDSDDDMPTYSVASSNPTRSFGGTKRQRLEDPEAEINEDVEDAEMPDVAGGGTDEGIDVGADEAVEAQKAGDVDPEQALEAVTSTEVPEKEDEAVGDKSTATESEGAIGTEETAETAKPSTVDALKAAGASVEAGHEAAKVTEAEGMESSSKGAAEETAAAGVGGTGVGPEAKEDQL
ncbi:hypothetical protein EX30DRAFT_140322 [Ascodesmis nigricans]|uniref:Uncharacterized protein n=1 Tax=Ascodesmis nigricans TaxID=341454 RepID=A0A4S2N147_9PEZI|nr:hypothetical protein EX30DRAFT_140322 [Ascodesmis nigricans]